MADSAINRITIDGQDYYVDPGVTEDMLREHLGSLQGGSVMAPGYPSGVKSSAPNPWTDVAKSAVSGAASAPANLANAAVTGIPRLYNLLEEFQSGQKRPTPFVSGADRLSQGFNKAIGANYEPQTEAGRLVGAGTGGAASALLTGGNPGPGLLSGLAQQGTTDVTGSEAAGALAGAVPHGVLAAGQGLRPTTAYKTVRDAITRTTTPQATAEINNLLGAGQREQLMAGQVAAATQPQSTIGRLWTKAATVGGENPIQDTLREQNPAAGQHPVADTIAQASTPQAKALAEALRKSSVVQGREVGFPAAKEATEELGALSIVAPEEMHHILHGSARGLPVIKGIMQRINSPDFTRMMSQPTLEGIRNEALSYNPKLVPDPWRSQAMGPLQAPTVSALKNAVRAYLVPQSTQTQPVQGQ